MPSNHTKKNKYMIAVHDDPSVSGALRFTFVPSGLNENVGSGEPRKPVPEYIATVVGHGDEAVFGWMNAPDTFAEKAKLEAVAKERVSERLAWLKLLRELVATIRGWADQMEWATKVTEKKMEDHTIGNYKAPALLLQHDATRLFLEPISRAAPGAEGLVDLYRMPAYDDVASLYRYGNRWNVHYLPPGTPLVNNIREAEAKPLTKNTLRAILDEMGKDDG